MIEFFVCPDEPNNLLSTQSCYWPFQVFSSSFCVSLSGRNVDVTISFNIFRRAIKWIQRTTNYQPLKFNHKYLDLILSIALLLASSLFRSHQNKSEKLMLFAAVWNREKVSNQNFIDRFSLTYLKVHSRFIHFKC